MWSGMSEEEKRAYTEDFKVPMHPCIMAASLTRSHEPALVLYVKHHSGLDSPGELICRSYHQRTALNYNCAGSS